MFFSIQTRTRWICRADYRLFGTVSACIGSRSRSQFHPCRSRRSISARKLKHPTFLLRDARPGVVDRFSLYGHVKFDIFSLTVCILRVSARGTSIGHTDGRIIILNHIATRARQWRLCRFEVRSTCNYWKFRHVRSRGVETAIRHEARLLLQTSFACISRSTFSAGSTRGMRDKF